MQTALTQETQLKLTKEFKNLEKSAVELTVTIAKKDVEEAYKFQTTQKTHRFRDSAKVTFRQMFLKENMVKRLKPTLSVR